MRSTFIAGAVVIAAATTASAEEVTLRAVSAFAEKTTYSRGFERFIEQVNRDGKGVLQINYIGGPKAMPPFEVGNALKSGVVDLANSTGAFYTNVMPEADSWKLTERPMSELRKNGGYDYMSHLYAEKMNAIFLARHVDGNPFHLYLNKPISSPTSLASRFALRRSTAIFSRCSERPSSRPRPARFIRRWSGESLTDMAGRSPASSISAGTRRRNIASIPASTPRKCRSW